MSSALKNDLERLLALAYHRLEWSGDLARRFHRLGKPIKAHPDFPQLEQLYRWLFVPVTLWAIDFDGLFRMALDRIASGKRLSRDTLLLLDLLPPVPGEKAQAKTREHEHAVQHGNYESLIHAQHKFDQIETEIARNPGFKTEWLAIKKTFDLKPFMDHKGIIRRRLVEERSMRANWGLRWSKPAERFREVFDVFCQRWNLYGMSGDKPLLMKLTLNLTPFGTMIFIPAYWSLDPKRDLRWREITALHKARGVQKQGEKLIRNRRDQEKEARAAARFWAAATKQGLRGEARFNTVIKQLGWDSRNDERKLRRLLKLAKPE